MAEDNEKPAKRPLAIALKYEHGRDSAPRVTAKGQGKTAETIIAKAQEHDIPIESNAALAEALARVELDQQIPRELYRAVAEVIGFVLRLSGPAPAQK